MNKLIVSFLILALVSPFGFGSFKSGFVAKLKSLSSSLTANHLLPFENGCAHHISDFVMDIDGLIVRIDNHELTANQAENIGINSVLDLIDSLASCAKIVYRDDPILEFSRALFHISTFSRDGHHIFETARDGDWYSCGFFTAKLLIDGAGVALGVSLDSSSLTTANQPINLKQIQFGGVSRSTPPSAWQCLPEWYDALDGCDCNCGAPDPDCAYTNQTVYGCYEGPSPYCTVSNGTCMYGEIPESWICPASYYHTNDGCDCECGAFDPDCNNPDSYLYNCDEGRGNITCSAEGICQYEIRVPDNWYCDNQYYANNDGCHCACGAWDPDCDNSEAYTFNCPCFNMKCDGNTIQCSGRCTDFVVGITTVSSGSNLDSIFT